MPFLVPSEDDVDKKSYILKKVGGRKERKETRGKGQR